MSKRLLLSALAVAFSAGAFLGVAGLDDWSWAGEAADSSASAPADWSWRVLAVGSDGDDAEAGAEA